MVRDRKLQFREREKMQQEMTASRTEKGRQSKTLCVSVCVFMTKQREVEVMETQLSVLWPKD